jgi:Acyclic terpene utilisation family protein AtuA
VAGPVTRGRDVTPDPHRPVRIANGSGFYGDRLAAPREVLDGPIAVDVLTGDYLAELTMLILAKARAKDPAAGYATTFVRQMEQILDRCVADGVKVVTNAGGLNPGALRDRLVRLVGERGHELRVAVVEGDDLSTRIDELRDAGVELNHLDTGCSLRDAGLEVATAHAYLGAWGIAAALERGADVVVCGRVTDASLVLGPAAWWHGWSRTDWDALAGAIVAGHVLECGPQATGGNYPFLSELAPGRPGFPIAEIADDGSAVITKQPATGGAVSVGTVTAQLLYELGAPDYPNPDVVARFDTVRLEAIAPDRVRISGTRGDPPPPTLKVGINAPGGYRNTMTMVITGLDVEAKAAHAEHLLFDVLGGREQFAAVDVQLVRTDHPDASTNAEATAQLRVTVKDPDATKVGRRFSNAVVELSLQSYAGFFTTTPPTPESAFGVFWPALVPVELVEHVVEHDDGTREVVVPVTAVSDARTVEAAPRTRLPAESGPTVRRPLGTVCGARSGDKGGNANIGVWTWDDQRYEWLRAHLTTDRVRALIPEAADLVVERHELPNLRALNFVVVGILGEGVASSVRFDPQAKGLGEYLRSRLVDLPARF